MKRIAQLAIALSGLFGAIACSENINIDLPETGNLITVTSQVGPQVKAGYDESNLPQTFYMDISVPSFSGTMTQSGNSNIYNFPAGTELTWGEANMEDVVIKAITAPDNTVYNRNTGLMTVKSDQSSDANIKASDLLGATIGDGITIQDDHINVAFKHLMSKLRVTYTSSITVRSITFKNAAVSGYYSYADMNYDYSQTLTTGNITMNHKSTTKTAEAIFFPYIPQSDKQPELSVVIGSGSNTKTLSCLIDLKSTESFVAGRCYEMKVAITGSSVSNAGIKVEAWDKDDNTQISGERVLWIGSSNAIGDSSNGMPSYTELVGDALNCTIVDNSIDGLSVISHLSKTAAELGSLSYASYESVIIPYLDGTKDKCTTIILDCGYADVDAMIPEANGLIAYASDMVIGEYVDPPTNSITRFTYYPVRGHAYLMQLKNKERTYAQYQSDVANSAGLAALGNYYIKSMCDMITKIQDQYPNIRIILGNYFTLASPQIANVWKWVITDLNPQWGDYSQFSNLICYYNEAVAGILDLDIINVQNYLWLNEEEFWTFCPDGIHPCKNPESAQTIADIYIRELDGVIGSR